MSSRNRTICNVDGQETTLIEDIAQGHKFTLKDIKKDQPIIKWLNRYIGDLLIYSTLIMSI